MRGREAAKAEQRRCNGDLLRFREGEYLLLRSRLRDAMPGEDDGPLRRLNQCDGFANCARFCAQHGVRTCGARCACSEFEWRGGLLRVLRDVGQYWAGSARG